MSYLQGEKSTCPLCAEEMDLTDEQLKPCKCGYDICVWCWHHIMDMAEKDETEGLCPACRTPYDKEKIVATAAKCQRLVAEINAELRKKKFNQKKVAEATASKVKYWSSKASTGELGRCLSNQQEVSRRSSARVIQRNLVNIVGLSLDLADEHLLQRREYFGQYGNVVRVSISRTAAGDNIRQFRNNTCSVYITYSKEKEAVRCIQNIEYDRGLFICYEDADRGGAGGRVVPLRACFGTTKYCHASPRNVPCTNPNCSYLHEEAKSQQTDSSPNNQR